MNYPSSAIAAMYAWFCTEPMNLRSATSIDNRCLNLLISERMEGDIYTARNTFFLPLVRAGVVEFYGNGRYGLSPTCVLYDKEYMLLINFPASILRSLEKSIVPVLPGVYRTIITREATHILSSIKVPQYRFDLHAIWQQLPKPAHVVCKWPTVTLDETSHFDFFDGGWKNSDHPKLPGVYRHYNKPYADRYCLLDFSKWKLIPNIEGNMDAFNFGVLYGKIQVQKILSVSYLAAESKLLISEPQFPAIIERLLVLNTLLMNPTNEIYKREYHVDRKTAKQIINWANNLINYAE